MPNAEHTIRLAESACRRRWPRVAPVVLLACAIAVFFVDLGGSSIWDANEAFYVETPREMLAAHDLVNPTFNYQPRFNKPVLSYWIVAGFYQAFGVSVGVQRVPIAIGAVVLIGCAGLLGRARRRRARRWARENCRCSGRRSGSRRTPRLMMFARRIFIDVWISAFLALALACFALAETRPAKRRRYLVFMYVSIALGVLTKGPVAIVLPGVAFALYLAGRRELRRTTGMMIPAGVLIVAAIVVPWYAALYHQHGWEQIRSFLVTENIARYTAGEGVRQDRGPLFYLPVLLSDSLPWSLLLVPAAALWRSWRSRVELLLWCWIVGIVVFFSISAGKQDLYILPIVPAVAALGGAALSRVTDARACRWVSRTLAVLGVLLVAAGAAVLYLFSGPGRVYALNGALAIGWVAVAGGLVAAGLGVRKRPLFAAGATAAVLIAANWLFVLRVLPAFERYKPVPALARTLAGRLQPGDAVAEYQLALPSLVYYLQRHVDQYFDAPAFVAAMQSGRRTYAVLSRDDYDSLDAQVRQRTCVIERRPTFNVKLGNVLAQDPLPDVLLVSNDCR